MDLLAQAALASGWPTLHVLVPDEAALVAARRVAEAVLGPLPQVDVLEPWDDGEPWELRIDLPDLDPARWVALRDALPGATLAPGMREGARTAEDLGFVHLDVIEAGGVVATMTSDAAGGVRVPDLQRGRPDAEIERLERELALTLQEDGLPAFVSDRGPDTVEPVVHRTTGRFGVRLAFPDEVFGALSGDAVLDVRERIVAAVGRVVKARETDPRVRLAPDLVWAVRWGLELFVWFVAPAVASLPGDQEVLPGLHPFPAALPDLVDGLDGLAEELEVQVLPERPADHDGIVDAVLAAEPAVPLHGGRPRWLRTADGWAFAPCWRILDLDGPRVREVVEQLGGIPGVRAVRVVPGEPAGQGERWAIADPSWHVGAHRWFVRLHDPRMDRDVLPPVTDRETDERDASLQARLRALPPRVLLVSARWVSDAAGRHGVELRADAAGAREESLRATLDFLGGLPMDDLCTLGWWGTRDAVPVVRLWWRDA